LVRHDQLRLERTRGSVKIKQAWAWLRKTYNSFTEGFESTDLKEAKILLDELSEFF
jgi:hypothetical protein